MIIKAYVVSVIHIYNLARKFHIQPVISNTFLPVRNTFLLLQSIIYKLDHSDEGAGGLSLSGKPKPQPNKTVKQHMKILGLSHISTSSHGGKIHGN